MQNLYQSKAIAGKFNVVINPIDIKTIKTIFYKALSDTMKTLYLMHFIFQ